MVTYFSRDELAEAKADDWLSRSTARVDSFLRSYGWTGRETDPEPVQQLQPALSIRLPTADEYLASAPWADLRPKPAPSSGTQSQQTGTEIRSSRPVAASGTPMPMPTGAPPQQDEPLGEIIEGDPEGFFRTAGAYARQVERETGVPAALSLAIAANETGYGQRRYQAGANNYHGIQALPGESGAVPYKDWRPDGAGGQSFYNAAQRSFATPLEGFRGFARFLLDNPRYQPALAKYRETGDVNQLAADIHAAGYAEDPQYTTKITSIMRGIPVSTGVGEVTDTRGVPLTGQQARPQAIPSAASRGTGTPQPMPTAPVTTGEDLTPDQAALDDPDKWALCGPVAAVAMARARGGNWTVAQAKRYASENGLWNASQGMGGLEAEAKLLRGMGYAAKTSAPDWTAITQDVATGNPVTLSTTFIDGGHYVVLEQYNPQTGQFKVGGLGNVLKKTSGRGQWYTLAELQELGGIQGALHFDNPATAAPSVAVADPNAAPATSSGAAQPDPAMQGAGSGAPSLAEIGVGTPQTMAQRDVITPSDEPVPGTRVPGRIIYADPDNPQPMPGRVYPLPDVEYDNSDQDYIHNIAPWELDYPVHRPATDPTWTGPMPNASPQRYGGPENQLMLTPSEVGRPQTMAMYGPEEYDPRDADSGPRESRPQVSTYNDPDQGGTLTDPKRNAPRLAAALDAVVNEEPRAPLPTSTYYEPEPPVYRPVPTAQTYPSPADDPGGAVQRAQDYGSRAPTQEEIDEAQRRSVAGVPPGQTHLTGRPVQPVVSPQREDPLLERGIPAAVRALPAAASAAGQAAVEEARSPGIVGTVGGLLPGPFGPMARGVSIYNAAQSAGADVIGRAVDEEVAGEDQVVGEIFGHPVTRRDVAGMIAQGLLDPTNFIPGAQAKPIARGVVGAGREIAGAARAAGRVGAEVAGAGARAAGRGARALGEEAAYQGTFGPLSTARRVVPPGVADTLDFPIRVPDDPSVIRAIEAAGGTVDERGVTLYVTRAQSPTGAGKPAARGMVFYEAVPEGGRSGYVSADNPKGVGGTQVIPRTPTRFKSPLILPDAPGSTRGFDEAVERFWTRTPEVEAAQRAMDDANAAQRQILRDREDAMRQWARSNGRPENDWAGFEQTPEGQRATAALKAQWAKTDAAQAALDAAHGNIPSSRALDKAIDAARAAGPEGSPARAQALKEVVARYGGEPVLVDELLKVRGADASESAWAIKENIVATNARRQGYDGVVTVQAQRAPFEAVNNHPLVKEAAAKEFAAFQELDAAQEASRAWHQQNPIRGINEPQPPYEEQFRVTNRVANAQSRLQEARKAVQEAEAQAQKELATGKITELADVREAANPTPPVATPELKAAYQRAKEAQYRESEAKRAALQAYSKGDQAEFQRLHQEAAAARLEIEEADAALGALIDAADTTPGYTLRSDLPRRSAQAMVPFDPASAALGGAGGAMSDEDGESDPWRTGLGIMIGGILGKKKGLNDAERAAWAKAIKAAAARGGKAADNLVSAARQEVQQGLPGVEPGPFRSEVPPAPMTDAPNRRPNLGDIPGSQIGRPMLPGMNPLHQPPPRPIGEVAADLAMTPEQRTATINRALEEFPGARNWYERQRMRNERQMAAGGREPVSAARYVGDLIGNIGYSSMLGPVTASVNVFTGIAEPLWNMGKEATRQGVRFAQTGNQMALREQGKIHAGARYGMTQVGEEVINAIMGRGRFASNPNFPTLSERTADPLGRLIAQVTEVPGRVWTSAPDAIFGTIALHAGQAREAAQIATNRGLRGQEWHDEIGRLLTDARATLRGELPTSPDVQQIVDAGNKYANRQSYRDELGTVGRMAGKVARLGNTPVLGPWASPFFTSIWNAGLRQAEKSPIGLAMNTESKSWRGLSHDKVYDAIVGTAVISAIGAYGTHGGVTGSGPSDPKEKELLREKGWQPYSTLVPMPNGQAYYFPNRLFAPFETVLNAAGEIHDYGAYQKKDSTGREKIDQGISRMGNLIRQNPYALSGIVSILETAKYGVASTVSDQVTRLTPFAATTRAIGTAMDPMERTTDRGKNVALVDEITQRWQQSVGLRQGLPEAQGAFGQPRPNEQAGAWAFVPRIRRAEESAAADVFLGAKVTPPQPKTELRPIADDPDLPEIKLTPREQRLWDWEQGNILRQVGERLAAHPKWAGATLEQRQEFLREQMREINEHADDAVRKDIGADELRRRAREALDKKAKAS